MGFVMIFNKPPLTFDHQVNLLLSRNLIASPDELKSRLKLVSYYRLGAYLLPFKDKASDNYREGTTLNKVWLHYTFDRQLRLIVMDAIERVEVAIITKLTHEFAMMHGPFGYVDKPNLPNISIQAHNNWLLQLKDETSRSREHFVDHFFNKYGANHNYLPLWMMSEIMSYGKVLTFYRGADRVIKTKVAKDINIDFRILESWLLALGTIRNICAHHGRLWNRVLGVKPHLPSGSKHSVWETPFKIDNDKMFSILTVLNYMMPFVAPTSSWSKRLIQLFDDYSDIPYNWMGFPDNWHDHELWKNV